jgi:hypothetical protein
MKPPLTLMYTNSKYNKTIKNKIKPHAKDWQRKTYALCINLYHNGIIRITIDICPTQT